MEHSIVDDQVELESTDTWCRILEGANFPIFMPSRLPGDLSVKRATFRPENPARPYPRSSIKYYLQDSAGNRLSIKEFNYDWAPAAYDCPSLWKNHDDFADVDTPEPKPYVIGNDVLWIGYTYRNQKGASLIKERTAIEMAVMKGDLQDQDFIQIASCLTPLCSSQRKRILAKNFAETSFGYSQAVSAVNVPISFWTFPLEDSHIQFQTAYAPEAVPAVAKHSHLSLPADCGYRLTSVFAYHALELPSEQSRFNFVYEHVDCKGIFIQLMHVHKDSPAACAFPPVPDTTQKCRVTTVNIDGVHCFYSYRSELYGPHELVFQRGEYNYLVLIKPARWTTRAWCMYMMTEILLIARTQELKVIK